MSHVNLSNIVVPRHYDLALTVHEEFFSGVVKIVCRAIKKISGFEINADKKLQIESVKVVVNKEEHLCSFSFSKDEEKKDDFVYIAFEKFEVQEGQDFDVHIAYKAEKYGNLDGFYKKADARGRPLFSTQFEPTDARKAFPCFDQPDMKATFKVSINCDAKYMALGNGEVENVIDEADGRKTYHFEKTLKMSTYIVAWVVGQLKAKEIKKDGLVVRLFATEEELDWADYSLNVAHACLKYFEEYFGIKYPLPKTDLVSIPSFASGAMENWGLITFRKTSLLFSKDHSFIRSKKIIANTVCHELAHMWFGNLVTMKWWDDLWLNEGFATWAASKALINLAKTHPKLVDWNEVTNFASSDIEGGLTADCLENTHKIAVQLRNPGEIDQVFDAISYDKGSSVIKMLEHWMGDIGFQKGIQHYLKRFEFTNAETKDLWEELNKTRDNNTIEIKDLMSSWVDRDGFPTVIVKEVKEGLLLEQKRFTKGYEKNDEPWPIPLTIRWFNKGNQTVEKILFKERTVTIPKNGDAYKLNDGMCTFIRVQYPESNTKALLGEYKADLNKVDVLNLVADYFEFAFALKGEFNFEEMLKALEGETNYEVIESALMNLNVLKSAFYDNPEMNQMFKNMQNKMIEKRLVELNLGKEENKKKSVNDLAIDSLCVTIGVQNGIFKVESDKVHHEFVKNYFVSLVDVNFEKTKEFYETSNLPGVKESALMALCKTKLDENVKKLFDGDKMDFADFVRINDIHYFAYAMGSNDKFRDSFAEFTMKNFTEFEKFIGDDGMFRSVVSGAFMNIHEEKMMAKVIEFMDKLIADPVMNNKYGRSCLKVKDHLKSTQMLREKIIEHYNKKKSEEKI